MRYAIVSDIHANFQAWQAVLEDIEALAVEKIICLGDIVGYGPEPSNCIQSVKDKVAVSILGNHDAVICEKMSTDQFNLRAKNMIDWTAVQVSKQDKEYLDSLDYEYAEDCFRCSHGDFVNPKEFNYITDVNDAKASWDATTEQLLFCGHSHLPYVYVMNSDGSESCGLEPQDFTLEDGNRYIVNVGSVGSPRDADLRACYIFYDSDTKSVFFRRIPYDFNVFRMMVNFKGLDPSDVPLLCNVLEEDESDGIPQADEQGDSPKQSIVVSEGASTLAKTVCLKDIDLSDLFKGVPSPMRPQAVTSAKESRTASFPLGGATPGVKNTGRFAASGTGNTGRFAPKTGNTGRFAPKTGNTGRFIAKTVPKSNSTGRIATGTTGRIPTGTTGRIPTGTTGRIPTGTTGRIPGGATGRIPSGTTGRIPSGATGKVPNVGLTAAAPSVASMPTGNASMPKVSNAASQDASTNAASKSPMRKRTITMSSSSQQTRTTATHTATNPTNAATKGSAKKKGGVGKIIGIAAVVLVLVGVGLKFSGVLGSSAPKLKSYPESQNLSVIDPSSISGANGNMLPLIDLPLPADPSSISPYRLVVSENAKVGKGPIAKSNISAIKILCDNAKHPISIQIDSPFVPVSRDNEYRVICKIFFSSDAKRTKDFRVTFRYSDGDNFDVSPSPATISFTKDVKLAEGFEDIEALNGMTSDAGWFTATTIVKDSIQSIHKYMSVSIEGGLEQGWVGIGGITLQQKQNKE